MLAIGKVKFKSQKLKSKSNNTKVGKIYHLVVKYLSKRFFAHKTYIFDKLMPDIKKPQNY